MKKQTFQPIRIFILSGFIALLCITSLIAIDTLIGSQEFLYQLSYGSKKEILKQLAENGLRIFIFLFFSIIMTHALYNVSRLLGRIALLASLATAYYLLQYNITLLGVFGVYWLLHLFLIRGVRL